MPASARSSTEGATFSFPPSPTRSVARRPKFSTTHVKLPPSPVDSYSDAYDEDSATAREEKRLIRDITRGTPGDHRRSIETQSPQQRDVARKRSQYYENAFAVNPQPTFSARDRVMRESYIIAEIKTNVLIPDEFVFTTEVSYVLSTRYQRPESSIIVNVAQSCCLLFGGSFEPAYILNITALPCHVLPMTNKRNAVLLGKSMQDALGVPPERGIIKFTAISEDNFANDGRTVTREIYEMEKASQEERNAPRSISSRDTMRTRRMPSIKSLRGYKANLFHHKRDEAGSIFSIKLGHQEPFVQQKSAEAMTIDQASQYSRTPRMRRRRSFITSIFGWT